jgi:hypothetical protein
LSITKSHMTTRSRTPDRSGGKPATNRLSYGAAVRPLYSESEEAPCCHGKELN